MASTNKSYSSTPLIGLNTTSDPSIIKPEELTYALNAKSHDPFYSNYEGNSLSLDLTSVKPGYNLIGSCLISNNNTCVWLVNNHDVKDGLNNSEIGIIDTKHKYTTVVNSYKLNFSVTSQIQAEYKPNVYGEDVVYWCDSHRNSMRSLNLSQLPGNINTDINSLNIFRSYTIPHIDLDNITSNGVLLAGAYQFTIQYSDVNGNDITPFIPSGNPIPVYKDSLGESYNYLNGDNTGTNTNKAISINISNLDNSFQYYNIAVIRTINGVQTASIVATLPTTQIRYVYNGTQSLKEISLSEITLKRITYKSASTVTQSNGYLLWGDLQGNKEFNLQPFVNNIQVQWNSEQVDSNSVVTTYKDPRNVFRKKVFMRDEVYSLGIEFDLTDGTTTASYHIPGRAKNHNSNSNLINKTTDQYSKTIISGQWDVTIFDSETINDVVDPSENERWKIYNTGYKSSSDAHGTFGEMSYWESNTFSYPNTPSIWGSLSGQPIRHHKFPDSSIIHVHDGLNDNSRSPEYSPRINLLGIRLPNIEQVIDSLPAEMKSRIQGWRILRGDRTYNKSVIAKGIISNMRELNFNFNSATSIPDMRLFQNYPFNHLGNDPWTRQNDNRSSGLEHVKIPTGPPASEYRKDMFSFFSPDTSFIKEYLVGNELKIESEEFGHAYTWYQVNPEMPAFTNLKDTDKTFPVMCQFNGYGSLTGYKVPRKGNIRRKLKEATYIPFNVETTSPNTGRIIHNNWRESMVFIAVDKDIPDPTVQDQSSYELGLPSAGNRIQIDANRQRQRELPISFYEASIKSNISGQYGSVFDIKYIDTGYNSTNTFNNTAIYGGDIFLSYFNIRRDFPFFGDALSRFLGTTNNKDAFDLRPARVIPTITAEYYRTDDDLGYYGYGGWNDPGGQMGYVLSVVNGCTGFWVESETNSDLRTEGEGKFDTYFPNLKSGSVKLVNYLGLEAATQDNYYGNNPDYSLDNKLYLFDTLSPSYDPNRDTLSDFYNKTIFSERSTSEEFYDNWLVYKALNYYDFPKSKGKLIDIRYIGQSRIIFRFEQALYIHNIYSNIESSEGEILLGSGKLFQRDPQEVSYSEVGTIGTRSQWAFNSTKLGQFMVDDVRAKIYLYNQDQYGRMIPTDISAIDMQLWFNDNLPLNLSTEFNISPDNPANFSGIGFISTYDNKNDIWLLTKRDYRVIDKDLITNERLVYTNNTFFLDNIPTDLNNTQVFENTSWTLGYSVRNQRWISYYSFLPDYYINSRLTYYSGLNTINGTSIWEHLNTNNFNTYYNQKYPFILETSIPSEGALSFKTSSISFSSKSLLPSNNNQTSYEKRLVTFNKAIIYNDEQCSGLLNLSIQDENNLSSFLLDSTINSNSNSLNISLRRRDNKFNFSEFFDLIKDREDEISFFTRDPLDSNYANSYPIDKILNNSSIDYNKQWYNKSNFKGRYIKVRLILDNTNLYQVITNFVLSNERVSVR